MLSVSEDMLEALEKEKKARKLETVPEAVRAVLYSFVEFVAKNVREQKREDEAKEEERLTRIVKKVLDEQAKHEAEEAN